MATYPLSGSTKDMERMQREQLAQLHRQKQELLQMQLQEQLFAKYHMEEYVLESQKAKPEDDFCEDNTKEIEDSS